MQQGNPISETSPTFSDVNQGLRNYLSLPLQNLNGQIYGLNSIQSPVLPPLFTPPNLSVTSSANPFFFLHTNPLNYAFSNLASDTQSNIPLQARLVALAQRNQLLNYYSGLTPGNGFLPFSSATSLTPESAATDSNSTTDTLDKNMFLSKHGGTLDKTNVDENVLTTISTLRAKAAKHTAAIGL